MITSPPEGAQAPAEPKREIDAHIEELAQWLDAKWARHKEIEDKEAAQALRDLSADYFRLLREKQAAPEGAGVRDALWRQGRQGRPPNDSSTYLNSPQAGELPALLPCPFCGHVGLNFGDGSTFRWLSYSCGGCAMGEEVRVQTLGEGTREQWLKQAEQDAVAEWNKRVPDPEIERLRTELQTLHTAYSHSQQQLEKATKAAMRGGMLQCDSCGGWHNKFWLPRCRNGETVPPVSTDGGGMNPDS